MDSYGRYAVLGILIPLWGSSSEAHVMQLGKKWGLDTKRIAGDHRHSPVHLMTAPTKN